MASRREQSPGRDESENSERRRREIEKEEPEEVLSTSEKLQIIARSTNDRNIGNIPP